MRVLMIVQQVDESHWLRGFTVGWIRALAAQVAALDVLALEAAPTDLPDNVTVFSMGKERGKNRARELWNFQRGMLRFAPRADVIFSHMTPLYTILAAPYAALFGKKQVLWYTHRQVDTALRLADRLVWRVTTAVPDSYGIPSGKARALGHGIDTDFFAPGDGPPPDDLPVVLQVARLMPIKRQETLIRALAKGVPARAVFVGADEQGTGYADRLKALAQELNVPVTFTGGLPAAEVRGWYRRAAVAVNLSPAGLFDKAVLESLACGTPTIVCNPAFDPLLGSCQPTLRINDPDDVDGLAARLLKLLALAEGDTRAMGDMLRKHTVEQHSLRQLMARLVRVFETGEPA
ncbi:MAG: glycosyltransferase [Chloroflexi bacterium]|nr:glycosyltransferase [Chloroflexota bacterium]MDL1883328.1 glycosyltransferase family 4 protein [Anaerolineae bacterium CFX8]